MEVALRAEDGALDHDRRDARGGGGHHGARLEASQDLLEDEEHAPDGRVERGGEPGSGAGRQQCRPLLAYRSDPRGDDRSQGFAQGFELGRRSLHGVRS